MSAQLDYEHLDQVFRQHVLEDIRLNVEHGRHLAAAQLLLSAVDIFSGMLRERHLVKTNRHVFVAWADRFLRLRGPTYTVSGIDLYAARCGFLHGYTPEADLVRSGEARALSWTTMSVPPVVELTDQVTMVSLPALVLAFIRGFDRSLVELEGDEDKIELVNERLQGMFCAHPVPEPVEQYYEALQEAEGPRSLKDYLNWYASYQLDIKLRQWKSPARGGA